MWLFIPYVIVQIALWFLSQGDFSVLAKSSEVFVILFTIRSAINVSDFNALISQSQEYMMRNIYRQFRRRCSTRLDSVYYRHIETIILVVVSLIFQFL